MYDLVSSSIIIINSKKRFKELLQDTYIKKRVVLLSIEFYR